MSLPILQVTSQPTPQTLVRLFHQTEAQWTRHIAEEEILDVGTAFINPHFPEIIDANRILGAALPLGTAPADAVAAAEAVYREKGTRLWAWVMNPSADAAQTQPLVEHLLANGFRQQSADILCLSHRPTITEVGGLKIIPARASFRHAKQLADEDSRRWNTPRLAEVAMLHLDDPHVDALLAWHDGQAVARVSVMAVGEVGRIEDLFVIEPMRRRGIGRTMMSRALEICARSLFKHVMLCCATENAAAQALYRNIGFEKIGNFDAYRAPAP